mgnify:CR=1 FL=1
MTTREREGERHQEAYSKQASERERVREGLRVRESEREGGGA